VVLSLFAGSVKAYVLYEDDEVPDEYIFLQLRLIYKILVTYGHS
jgi:hypothetical protein